MRVSWTLSLYFGRQFIIGFAGALVVLAALVFLFDFIETLRRASGRSGISVFQVAGLALLQLPLLMQKLLPFAALFGGMFTFSRLTRTNELAVARASGVSVWQFMLPSALIALGIGVFVITTFNPLSAATADRHEQLEARYLHGRPSLLALSSTGIWLRQADETGQSVIYAQSISQQGLTFNELTIFLYHGETPDTFTGRIDARTGQLAPGHWVLNNVILTSPDKPAETVDRYELPTTLTLSQIQESFAAPETLSFWALPRFIELLQRSGFAALKHRVHWHSILSTPLILFAMVLIAAAFSLRLTRRGGTALLVAGGVAAGFLFYLMTDLVLALGLSGKVPATLAAWAPAGISTLLGLALLFHLEDG